MRLFSRGRGPSQSNHSFACKQAKRDISASRKVGFLFPASPTLLGWAARNKLKHLLFVCKNLLLAGRRKRCGVNTAVSCRPLRVCGKSGLADIKNFSTPFFHRLWITFPTILGKTGSFPQAIIFICVSAVYFQNSDQISRFSASFAMQTKFN